MIDIRTFKNGDRITINSHQFPFLSEGVKRVLIPYCEEMIRLHGENLLAILLYGSATGEDFVPKTSNINLLLYLKKIELSDLKKSLKLVEKGRRKRIVAPLFFTPHQLQSSLDVFPIEFLEIKENHLTLYGQDPFENLEIQKGNIRLQCEEQLKGKYLRLCQAYLEIGPVKKGLERVMRESLISLIPVFRNLLRLKVEKPPLGKEEVLRRIGEEFGVHGDTFFEILKGKQKNEWMTSLQAERIFERYLHEIEKISNVIDQL